MQKLLRLLVTMAFFMAPWVTMGQNARVSEYDGSSATATYSSIVSTGTAQTLSGGYADITMPFAMYFGETQVPQGSTLRIWSDGSVTFDGIAALTDARIAPLYLAAGYTTTQVYTRSTTQVLTVEWRKAVSGNNSYSFQLKLYPGGDIEFCYGPMTINGSINVLVGMMSSSTDIYRVGGRDNGSQWDTIYRNTTGTTTRTLSTNYYPAFNTATNQGLVYTFTQPACVKPTGITATATAWNTIQVDWTVSSNGNGYEVKYSTDANFNPDNEGQSKSINSGTTLTTNITGLSGSTPYYFYVRKNCSGTTSGWSPMATATTLPGCFNANLPNVTADGIVTWTSPNDMVTSYNIKYGVSGFDPANEGTAVNNIAGLTYTLTGLTQLATYDVYMSTNCSASGLSTDWVGPVTFTYFTGSVYTMGTDDDVTTCTALIYDDGGPTGEYGASIDYTLIVRPGTASNNIRLQGTYNMESGYDFIYIYNGVGTSGTQLLYNSGEGNVNVVSSDPSGALTIRITSDGSVFYSGFELAASCEPMPTCPNPAAPTADADGVVTWTNSNNATSYDIIWGPTGFNPATEGTLVSNLTGTTYTLTGWASNTTYDVYVRAHCSATNETSDWSDGYTFTTACVPLALPYSEDFTDYSYPTYPYYGPATIPTCWDYYSNGTNTAATTGSSAYYGTVAYYSSTSSYACMEAYNKYFFMPCYGPSSSYAAQRGSQKILVLPKFAQSISTLSIYFDYKMTSTSYGTLQLGYYANGEFTSLTTVPSKSATTHYEQILGNLTGINDAPASARIALKWYQTSGSSVYHVGIDNVVVEQTPTCAKPAWDLTATVVTPTSATLAWTGNSTYKYEVKAGPAGFDPATEGRSTIVTTNTVTLDYLYVTTNYDVYVRGICTAGDTSAWSNVQSFKTGCPTGGDIVVGNESSTTTSTYLPEYHYYNYSLSEQIFTPAEIGGAGTFSSISFYITQAKSGMTRNVDIYLKETTKSSFSSTTDWESASGAQLIYSGNYAPAETGWMTIDFSSSFTYSGENNLMLIFYDKTGSYVGSPYATYKTSASAASNMSLYKYQDGTGIDPMNMTIAGTRLTVHNVIKLGAPCDSGSCNAPVTAIALSETEYAATLTFTDVNGETNPTYGIVYGPKGFDPATAGTTVSPITANTYTISGLNMLTEYDVYVYAICSGTDGRKVRYSFTTPFIPNCKTPVLSESGYGAANITYNTADLTWRQPGDAPLYWVVRYSDVDFNPATAAAGDYNEMTVTTAAANLTGLTAGTTYYIYVKSVCVESPLDESPWSETYSFSTTTCAVPTGLAASDVTNSTVTLSWNNASGLMGWVVVYGTYDDFTNGTYQMVATSTNSLEIEGLDPYTTYYANVYARCTENDYSNGTSYINFTTKCPDGGDIVLGDLNNASTTNYLPTYHYYNYSLTEQIFTADELGGANTFSSISFYVYTAKSTTRNVDIYLVETDKADFTSTSDWISTSGVTPVYSGNFTPSSTGWLTFDFATPYEYTGANNLVVVMHDKTGSYVSSPYAAYVTSASPASNMALYKYQDGTGIDPANMTIAGTLMSSRNVIVLGAPCNTNVTCFAPASVNANVAPNNNVTVTWAPRTDLRPMVNNYELKYGPEGFDPDVTGVLVNDLNNVNTYTITATLDYNTAYDVYVRTVCDASNDDYSSWGKSSFNTHPSCWAPVNVTIAGTTQNTVTLSWANNADAPTQATRWEVAYGLKGFNPDNATPVETTNNTAFVVNNLKHSTKYEFYVRAICSATDQSDWSAVATGTTQCGVWQYADMPLVENFDDYTGNTGTASTNHVMPRCWSWLNGGTSNAGLPSIYLGATNAHSGTNSLRFYRYNSTSDSYKDQFAILPEFGFALDTLVVNFSAKMTSTAANFYIGTMSDPDDSTTFHMIAPVTATNTNYNDYEFVLADYNINSSDRYIAFVQRKAGGSYNIYLDDLTVKVREKVNTLSTTGGTMNICNEYIMPDTTGGNYIGNINATYVIRPAEAGKVAHIAGSYDLENGYDYLNVYRGAATANNLVGRYTGTGNIDYVTGSNLWADSGYVTLVFTTDADNALSNTGFKLLVSCECPQASTEPVIDNVEVNGTYTWTAGNGRTYTKHSTMEAANDLVEEADYTLINVAGCDSATRHLNLIVHPTYELNYSHTMCARDEYVFYGNTYTATGTYTVALQSVFGADSVGILNLQVNPAPTVGIYYNGNQETAVDAFCDNFDMALLARSNVSGATFAWDDNSTDANRVVNPHESSTYTVVATDPTTGCTSLPATLTVTTTPVPALTISGTNEICYGQSTTLTVADANNLDAAYRWNTGATTTSITVNPTTTTTYTVTATTNNASACAVTAEYTVTVNPLPVIATPTTSVSELCLNESVTLTAAAVDGYTYLWNNGATTAVATAVPTATGAYTVTVTDAKGCQQDFSTAAITVHPSYELSEERSACVGMLPYTWGAMTLNAAGNYDQHFTIAHGCDSLVHLTFAVQDTTVINSTRELCLNTPFTFGTGIYEQSYVATETGVISYVDTTSDECPTRYNLHLTVNMPVTTSFAEDVCDTYTWNNVEYTATGAYNQTLATTKGCDSVVTLNLTVRVSTVGVDEQNVCDKLVWIDGNTYTEPNNSAVFTITNQAGCDSVVTLNLTTVRHATEGVDNILYCDDTIYTWLNGRTYSLSETDGNIKYLLPNTTNAAGCDTTVILNLVMNPVRDTLNWVNVDACDEYEIDTISCDGQIGTKFIRQSGDYQLRTRNTATGRDRITRIHLTVTPSVYHTTIATECLPYTWTIMGENGNPFEIATITAADVNGASVYSTSVDLAEAGFVTSTCSKIEVLRLTPKYPTTETIMDTICQNGSWTAPNNYVVYNGSDLNIGENTMTWRNTELNADGCQKTEQVVLTVNPVANVTVNPVYCESAFTYNETTGEYYVVYTNEDNNEDTVHLTIPGDLLEQDYAATRNVTWQLATGCDNNVTINYTVTATQRDTMSAVACYEYTWNENGVTYERSIFDSVVYDNDCRVISYLDLTINDTVREYDTIDVCTSYEYNGETYRETKTFRELVGTAESGCDSVLYMTYNVHQRALNEQYIVSNKPYTWANGETYNASTDGIYYNVPVAPGQCDSVLLLHFTMSEPVVLCEGQLPYTVTVGNTSFIIPAGANSDEWTNNDAQGNDTIIAYTINHNTIETVNDIACDSYTWTNGDGAVYTVSGVYTYDTSDGNGCTRHVTLNLVVNASTHDSFTAEECDTYTWNNNGNTITKTESGVYTSEYTNADNCPSVDTLHLTINVNEGVEITEAACVTYTWERDGQTYTASGDHSVSFTDANGCVGDSVLHLTINQPISVEETIVVNADTASYRFNGVLYTAPYDYTNDGDIVVNTTSTVTGCDSTYTLHLIIPFVNTIEEVSVNACGTYKWDVNGHIYKWIPMSERQSHGYALYKDSTANRYVYTNPVDTVFDATTGAMESIKMLVLNLMEAEYSTATLNIPLSLGTYTILGVDAAHNRTYDFSGETVVGTEFYLRDTVMEASTAYCANYVDYTINLVNNYTISRDTVCDNVTTYTWNGVDNTIGIPGHTFEFEHVENAGTLNETVDSMYLYQLPVNNTAVDVVTACDSTEWNGTWYYATGTDTYSTTTARGCDSLITLNLTVNASTHASITVEDCDSYTWTNNGNTFTYTESGVYTNSYVNAANCASTDTLHLTIKNNSNQGYTVAACNSYTWERDGLAYTTSGDKTYSYTATNGCPSVDTLHLTINLPASTGYTEMACDSTEWNGTKYYTSGTYYYDYNTAAGCASVDTLYLTVNNATHNSETLTQCDSYEWNGTTYTESSPAVGYTYQYTNTAGCASVDTLHLTINVNTTGVEVTEIACDEYTWSINNRLYNTSGTYTARTTDDNGCGTTNTLHLTINSTSSYDSVLYISDGSYRYTAQNGTQTFYQPGTYSLEEHYTNAENCDSTLRITLNVGTALLEIEPATSCSQYTWRNGKTYTWLSMADRIANANSEGQNAIYYNATDQEYVYYNPTYTVHNTTGYDSVYILNLTLTQSTTTQDVVNFPISLEVLRYGDSIFDFSTLDDKDFVNTTVYREVHFHSDYYCDSIVDLTINLVNNYTEVATADICVTESEYTWRNQTISTATTDYDNAHTYYIYEVQANADSLLTTVEYMTLTQHPVVYATERRTACDSYTWNGHTYTESTSNATEFFPNGSQYGCDSTVTLMLTIKHNTNANPVVNACETYTWTATDGVEVGTYTQSGVFEHEYVADNGCPSVDVLTLTVNYNTSTADTQDVCDSYTWTNGDGNTYTTTVHAIDTILYNYNSAVGNCPSTDTLYLTIRHNSNQTYTKTACDTYTWTDGGNGETYTVSGVYTYDYTATNGCPSTNTLNLTVNQNSSTETIITDACDSVDWHGMRYATGDYTYDYVDVNNCPSVDVLHLTVNNATNNAYTEVACNTYTWTEGDGNTYTTSGTYTNDYINAAGCASTDTLHLTIGSGHAYGIERVTVCGPYTWVVNGDTIATLGESVETSTSVVNPATGCDSTIFLYLTVNPQTITNVAICDNQTYTWTVNNTEYSAAGTYNVPVNDANGNCVSEDVLVLTVNPTKVTNLTDQVCLGNGYTANGFNIAAVDLPAAGEYTFVLNLSTTAGCDSTVNLTLTVGDTISNVVAAVEACDSYSWTAGDGETYTYTVSGTYNSTAYANAQGCTTVDVLTLTINNNSSTEYTETVCDAYMWNGTQYTASGDYTYDYIDGNGCASTDVLHLTVNSSAVNTIEVTACDTYTWTTGDGETYTTSGVHTHNYTTTDGCNGTDYLVLTINNSTSSNANVTACDSYTWHGTLYDQSGAYTFDTLNAVGCDSTATLTLTINASNTGVDVQTACDSYTWIDGNVYTASNSTATYTLTNAAGCDSVVTLNLTINASVANSINVESCNSYVWENTYYDASGVYEKTFQAANGCDSVVTMTLVINTPVATSFNDTACGSYTWNGISYTATSAYTQTFTAANGCDSVVTLNLTVNQPVANAISAAVCDTYAWDGSNYTAPGTYTRTYSAANGCDSVVTLTLTKLPAAQMTVAQTACDSYTWNGQTYTTSGNYTWTGTAANGCDSVVTLALTVNTSVTATATATACQSYTWNGQTYTTSGNYTWTGTAANGCDSTVTLTLTVNTPVNVAINATACGSYTWNNVIYSNSGVYTQTFTAANGCDSIVTLTLTINQPTSGTETAEACGSYTWHGQTYTASGFYNYDNLTNAAGCDSSATLMLTIKQPVYATVNAEACDSYTWNNENYTVSGSYLDTAVAANGCDSITTLVLTINNSTTGAFEVTACGSYNWNGTIYNNDGTYTQTLSTVNGCDSVVTLTLTINMPIEVIVTEEACSSYEWNGQTYTESGTYSVTSTAANGCDSITTLNLTINMPTYSTNTVTAAESYTWNGQTYTESGTYVWNGTNAAGCDSIATLILTIDHYYAVTLTVNDATMGSVQGAGVYLADATVNVTATANNGYHFVGWVNGTDTVSRVETYSFTVTEDVLLLAVFAQDAPNAIDVTDMSNVTIYSSDTRIFVRGAEGYDVYVYDVNGRVMNSQMNAGEAIEFRMPATGVYLVKVGNAPAKRVLVVR